MSRRRDEFTHQQKAELFARDRAMCSFSGRSLWHLDYGAGPAMMDCVDHVVPTCKGGKAELENGACATWIHNKLKLDSHDSIYLFRAGRPTSDFYILYETVPEHVIAHLRRFAALHPSDWYFNRTVIRILLANDSTGQTRVDGKPYARGREYWCKAAMKSLVQWHRLVDQGHLADFGSRGLLPPTPSADQKLLLALQQPLSVNDLLELSAALHPYSEASGRALDDLSLVETKAQAVALMAQVDADIYVVPRVKNAIRHNLVALYLDAPGAQRERRNEKRASARRKSASDRERSRVG
jgi:hypothetical protein